MFLGHISEFIKDHTPLPIFNNKKVFTLSQLCIQSNVCPHQGSIIVKEPHNGIRTCPYHAWSFDDLGNPVASGKTKEHCENKKALAVEQSHVWNNLVFSEKVEFETSVDFSNMRLHSHRVDFVKSTASTIMNIFLDVDHIDVVHKGVYDKIGSSNIKPEWSFYSNGSKQSVEKDRLIWLALYPNTMIEYQPGALFVTVCKETEGGTEVYVYKYFDDISKWELNEKVWEEAWKQDKELAEGIFEVEIPIENLEIQKRHFKEFQSKKVSLTFS